MREFGLDLMIKFPNIYTLKGNKVLVYIQSKYTKKNPHSRYLHTIIKGYKDCNLDMKYPKKKNFYIDSINYNINW